MTCTTMVLAEMPAVQALQWWTDSELDEIRVCLEDACTAWVLDWLGGSAKVETTVAHAHERLPAKGETWIQIGTCGESTAWLQTRRGAVEDALHSLFQFEPGHGASLSVQGIAYAVAAKAQMALVKTLQARVGLSSAADEAQPADALFKPWSGSVLMSLATPRLNAIAVLLNGAAVRSILDAIARSTQPRRPQPSQPAPDSLLQALSHRTLALRVALSPCELDLGALESLRVGDIVPLPHSLDAPLQVSMLHGGHVCVGFLGRQDGHKAVELTREVSAEHDAAQPTHSKKIHEL